jgi:hypothetical protein
MKCCDTLEELRKMERFVLSQSNYISQKIKNIDSDLRMKVMSDFERKDLQDLKNFLSSLDNLIR